MLIEHVPIDAADQMLTAGGVSYGYDANGNQRSRGGDAYTYDHENRLTQTVIGGVTSTSVYNGDGLRMSHTVDQTTTDYGWDVAAGLPVVLQDGTNTYVYGLDLISATDSQGAQTYFLYDGLGSVVGLTDDQGDEIDDYTYDVFGAVRSQAPSPTLDGTILDQDHRRRSGGVRLCLARDHHFDVYGRQSSSSFLAPQLGGLGRR